MHQDPELVDVPTERGDLLAVELERFVTRHLSLTKPVRALLPIWTMHTYVLDKFEFSPYLNIISPEPGCGKTTTADILSALCCRATSPTCGTAAVLRRKIAAEKPTLILDEWDTLHVGIRRECLNFLNTGFRSDGTYGFVLGSKTVELSTFCPKAIVGRSIVALPEATQSRCISFVIHKAPANENLEKFRKAGRDEAALLRQKCENWAAGFGSSQVKVAPYMPPFLQRTPAGYFRSLARHQRRLRRIVAKGLTRWTHSIIFRTANSNT